ncbi:hypothetical protein [Nitrosomonas communis]|nr:hypothetical protein [Nitrosomonas communis]
MILDVLRQHLHVDLSCRLVASGPGPGSFNPTGSRPYAKTLRHLRD